MTGIVEIREHACRAPGRNVARNVASQDDLGVGRGGTRRSDCGSPNSSCPLPGTPAEPGARLGTWSALWRPCSRSRRLAVSARQEGGAACPAAARVGPRPLRCTPPSSGPRPGPSRLRAPRSRAFGVPQGDSGLQCTARLAPWPTTSTRGTRFRPPATRPPRLSLPPTTFPPNGLLTARREDVAPSPRPGACAGHSPEQPRAARPHLPELRGTARGAEVQALLPLRLLRLVL